MTKQEFMQRAMLAMLTRSDVYYYQRVEMAEVAWKDLVSHGYAQDVTVDHYAAWLAKQQEGKPSAAR